MLFVVEKESLRLVNAEIRQPMLAGGMNVTYLAAAMCWSSVSNAFAKSTVMQWTPSFSSMLRI